MQAIRVILADDHPVIRTGIRTMLERAPDIMVVAEAASGDEALRIVAAVPADVLVLDMEMPGANGVEVARQIRTADLPIHILVLSAYARDELIADILQQGAAGYLVKEEAPDHIISAVRGVAQGEEGWLSRRVTATVIKQQAVPKIAPKTPETLSSREREVLELVALGCDNQRVAEVLNICDGTVKNHITNIYGKLQVRTRAEAVAWAWHHHIVSSKTQRLGISS
jgi:DNA-binding NarL/FixJ family response regulator